MMNPLDHLAPEIRNLLADFRDGLTSVLNENLVGVYLLGSIAFPEFEPHAADIDFHVVIRRPLSREEQKALDKLHRSLAKKFRFGARLDGFYISLEKVKECRIPDGLFAAADGRLHAGGKDEAWALHREHLHHGGHITLFGPDPRKLYPSTSKEEIEAGLDHELDDIREHFRQYPFYAVLNLCRLIYSWTTRRITVSKRAAADWALEHLPARWRGLIQAALRSYAGKEDASDRRLLREQVEEFFKFASGRTAKAKQTGAVGKRK